MSFEKEILEAERELGREWDLYLGQTANYVNLLTRSKSPEFYKKLTNLFQHLRITYFLQPENEAKGIRELFLDHETIPKQLWRELYTGVPGVIVSVDNQRIEDIAESDFYEEVTGLEITADSYPQDVEIKRDFNSLEKLKLKNFKTSKIDELPNLKEIVISDRPHFFEKLEVPIAPKLEIVHLWSIPQYSKPYLLIPKHTRTIGAQNSVVERYEP